MQKLKINEARPKFTGSYKKKTCIQNGGCELAVLITVSDAKACKYSQNITNAQNTNKTIRL